MSESTSKSKAALALGIVVIVLGAAAGIFRAVGCEKGAEITETAGTAVDNVADSLSDEEPNAEEPAAEDNAAGAGGAPSE